MHCRKNSLKGGGKWKCRNPDPDNRLTIFSVNLLEERTSFCYLLDQFQKIHVFSLTWSCNLAESRLFGFLEKSIWANFLSFANFLDFHISGVCTSPWWFDSQIVVKLKGDWGLNGAPLELAPHFHIPMYIWISMSLCSICMLVKKHSPYLEHSKIIYNHYSINQNI